MRITVIGLGKLGCPMAALLAAAGHEVVGADVNPDTVAAVNRGAAPVRETGLDDLMVRAARRLSATTDVAAAAATSEIVFCIVPTPSLPDASFDTAYAETAFEDIGRGFAQSPGDRRVAVLTSTVLPGATEARVQLALERGSGELVGEHLGLCYSPEFIALGSVIENMVRPDMVLMGASASWAAEVAVSAILSVAENDPPVALMSIAEAEVTKIAVNGFITTKISYANMLAEICERLPGVDAAVVTAAVGLDSRIGRQYLSPGAPYGGPCFPRDNAALSAWARSVGARADLAEATDTINRRRGDDLVERIVAATGGMEAGAKVAVLGLSYKAATPVVDEAFGVKVATELSRRGLAVRAYDPMAEVDIAGVERAVSAAAAIEGAQIVVVATPWPEFAELDHIGAELVVDCWRIVNRAALNPSARLVWPGVGDDMRRRAGADRA